MGVPKRPKMTMWSRVAEEDHQVVIHVRLSEPERSLSIPLPAFRAVRNEYSGPRRVWGLEIEMRHHDSFRCSQA